MHKRDRVVRLLYDSQDFYMGPFTSVCAVPLLLFRDGPFRDSYASTSAYFTTRHKLEGELTPMTWMWSTALWRQITHAMHEEHLCIVALTSNGARNPVLSACLLPPRVIAYCSSSTSRWITGSCTWIMKIRIIMVPCCARFNDCIGFVFIVWWCIGLSSLLLVSLHGD